ncbi:Na(+)/H(+) antiporter NhaP [Poriferisphaera corsica]|uniref:Na(+)/H(+) antiporter NhaP n=1 Tax=Poriferisphaera corsica TaxID=2528020 RepID=A0A517YVG9_9BACT|nr:sodium:proton antiporter [Poriferisphaera corsica]QDU34162.1 Na(+)/H(+) antiporter NhaP [Poriferisphaera corsica]
MHNALNIFEIGAILISLVAILAYLNAKILKLPATIGLMLLALLFSFGLFAYEKFGPAGHDLELWISNLLSAIDFNKTLLQGMLGYLLFAGALHVNLGDLKQQRWVIALLATVGVLTTTGIVGAVMYYVTGLMGLEIKFVYCLLFGALIAPTDPIAVLSILKSLGAPKTLETKITGESLFNDGVGVVVFLAILGFAIPTGGHEVGGKEIAILFFKETGGGALFGLLLGLVGYVMMRSLDEYKTEILISLAMVTGGYALCTALHISGPIAMVVAGLFIGNHGRAFAMSDTTRENLDLFWELVDEILNAVLFVLIGIEVLIVKLTGQYVLAGLIAIPIVLAARFISVSGTVKVVKTVRQREFTNHAVKVMTWAGLRGGISVALALSLQNMLKANSGAFDLRGDAAAGDLIVTMTYVVVVFSILVQGLTVGGMMRRLGLSSGARTKTH